MTDTEWGPVSAGEWRRLVGRHRSRRGIQEIRSGAIIPDPQAPGHYRIEANTSEGLRRFRQAEEEACMDIQSEGFSVVFKDVYISHASTEWWHLAQHWSSVLLGWAWEESLPTPEPEKLGRRTGLSHVTAEAPSPDFVLAILEDAGISHPEKRRMVIEAEVLTFGPEDRQRLNAILRRFIEDHRNSDDPEDLVAVASAIRKYVATMDRNDLGALAVLLASDENATVPLEVELEVAKTAARTLAVHPPGEPDSQPELGDRLMDVAGTYLNARLLSREKYGAVALNAVLALLLLRSRHVPVLLATLRNLRVPWFTELVVRRAGRIRDDLLCRFPEAEAVRYLEGLNTVCDALATTET